MLNLRNFVAALLILACACRTTSGSPNADDAKSLPELFSGEVPLNPAAKLPIPTPTPSPVTPVVMTVPAPSKSPTVEKKSSSAVNKRAKPSKNTAPASASNLTNVAPNSAAPVNATAPSPSPSPVITKLLIPTSEDYRTCKQPEIKPTQMTREEAYSDAVFRPGERATYEVFYGGVLGGYGSIEVDNPTLIDGLWHRVLRAEASTGDWFKSIFVGKYKILSTSRSWDYGIRRFYMETDEGKLFGSRTALKKWVEFDHTNCAGNERTIKNKNPEKQVTTVFNRSSTDVLGAYFALRERHYQVGRIENVPVYTGEKNWTLEATPLVVEEVETAAGKFNATKLKLQTYIGQELQQKGDVNIWIAETLKERVLVQVKADVKVGSIYVKLKEFKPGK